MDQGTMALLTGLIGTIMVTGLLGCAIVGAYVVGRSRAARPPAAPDADRLVRMERLLEGLVVEVERIGEAQRYSTGVLRNQEARLTSARESEAKTQPEAR